MRMNIRRVGRSGQALVEFAYFAVFSTSFVGIAGLILKEEWNRSKCAYLTFEATHRDLVSPWIAPATRGFSFQVEKRGHQITGTGQCGKHTEKVSLPFLESAQW